MTTIVTDGHTIAADRQATTGHGQKSTLPFAKIRKLPTGELIGGSGDLTTVYTALEWFSNGQPDDAKPTLDDDITLILVTQAGTFRLDKRLTRMPVTVPNAIGSGQDYALGALSAGATVTEALEIAAQYDAYTGDSHDVLSLDAPKPASVSYISGERYDLKSAKRNASSSTL